MTIPIRSGLQVFDGGEVTHPNAPSLLFYYLFDDWFTSYSLVARKEQQYGVQLEKLRGKMFAKPEVGDVKDLHNIGRQLAVLQRIYQSYVLIIERILDRQTPLKSQAKHTHGHVRVHNIQQALENDSTTKGNEIANKQNLEVSLSPAATVRFERLKDRINLYALSEIKECLTEKESLVFLVRGDEGKDIDSRFCINFVGKFLEQ
ncbi:MAG: hypothetical protein Q9190_005753 [Brigantiaea leucoxantha]